MAQIKISELELNTQMSNEDVLAGVDTSEQKTKKFKLETLKNFINKEQDEQITKNKNDISANATNIETNAKDISNNSKNIEKNTLDIVENKKNITDNTNRVKRITNDLYDSGEANGTSINIKDSTLAEFQEISVDGVCKQVTTQGYNLANKNDSTENVNDKYNFEVGNITNGKDYSLYINIDGYVSLNIRYDNSNGTIIKSLFDLSNINVINFTSNVDGILFINCFSSNRGTYNNIKEIMLVEGTYTKNTMPPFEKFTGGQASPNPSYPQNIEVIDEGFEVKSCGKNLFDTSKYVSTNEVTVVDNTNGVLELQGVNGYYAELTKKFNLEQGKTYTFSYYGEILNTAVDSKAYVRIRDINNTNLVTPLLSGEQKASFICPSDGVVIFSFRVNGETNIGHTKYSNIQLEKRDKATDFEPYQETRVPIDLKGEFVGKLSDTIKDQIRIAFNEEDGQTHVPLSKKLGIKVLNGTEDWITPTNFSYALPKQSFPNAKLTSYTTNEVITSHYRVVPGQQEAVIGTMWIGSSNVNFNYDNSSSNLEGFKQALSENPIIVIYELAEPYTIDLGVVDMPLSYSPETNVFTTSELEAIINAKYYRNFINTIQNLQVNEKALKEELIDIQNQLKALQVNVSNLSVLATNDEVESEVVE